MATTRMASCPGWPQPAEPAKQEPCRGEGAGVDGGGAGIKGRMMLLLHSRIAPSLVLSSTKKDVTFIAKSFLMLDLTFRLAFEGSGDLRGSVLATAWHTFT